MLRHAFIGQVTPTNSPGAAHAVTPTETTPPPSPTPSASSTIQPSSSPTNSTASTFFDDKSSVFSLKLKFNERSSSCPPRVSVRRVKPHPNVK